MGEQPVSVFDVVAYVLERAAPMTTMKLQKIVYYCQAWSLVWDEAPLFSEEIEAWASGPVIRELYEAHRGKFEVARSNFKQGDPARLSAQQRETVEAVLGFYGDKSAQWLSELTHMELPWKETRDGLPDMSRSDRVIGLATMAEYYSSLQGE